LDFTFVFGDGWDDSAKDKEIKASNTLVKTKEKQTQIDSRRNGTTFFNFRLTKADAPTKHVWQIKESYPVSMKLKYC